MGRFSRRSCRSASLGQRPRPRTRVAVIMVQHPGMAATNAASSRRPARASSLCMRPESNGRLCATSLEQARASLRNASRTSSNGWPFSHAISCVMPWIAVADSGMITPGWGRTMRVSWRVWWDTIQLIDTRRADSCAATRKGSSSLERERRRSGSPVVSVSTTMNLWEACVCGMDVGEEVGHRLGWSSLTLNESLWRGMHTDSFQSWTSSGACTQPRATLYVPSNKGCSRSPRSCRKTLKDSRVAEVEAGVVAAAREARARMAVSLATCSSRCSPRPVAAGHQVPRTATRVAELALVDDDAHNSHCKLMPVDRATAVYHPHRRAAFDPARAQAPGT